jgi:hypothetical protein
MMPQDWVTQLEQRVHYVRLDGDGEATRRQFMQVSTWSEDDFREEVKVLRKSCLRGEDDCLETSDFLQHAFQFYKARFIQGRSLEHFIKVCLQDGNDVRLARMIFQKDLKRVTNPKLDEWRREAFFECGNDRKKYIPVSPEETHKGLVELLAEIGDYRRYDKQRYLEAAIAFPKEYARYVHERVLPERPEPHMTKEDMIAVCLNRGRKRRHSECTNNFKDGGRIICDDAADEIDTTLIDDFDLWRCANAINKVRKINH